MERHLYRRKIGETKKKEPIRAWYFWYLDPVTKKQVRKSCGTAKNPVFLKRDAENIIEQLEKKDREYLAMRAEVESVTIAKMVDAMFADGSTYLKRRQDEGYVKDAETLKEIRGYLKNFIVKNYGHLKPEELDPAVVDNDLVQAKYSNSWKNRIVSILNWILDEAIWLKMLKVKPVLKKYKRNTKQKSILTREEMDKLFPDDFNELSKIWNKDKTVSDEGFMFGTLYALMTSTGLRNGEARGISPSQLILSDGEKIAKMVGPDGREAINPLGETKNEIRYGLVLDRMLNRQNKTVMHLKKGDEKNRKMRIEVIPDKTVKYLKRWLSIRPVNELDLLFTFRGDRIKCPYLIYRFGIGLRNAGISTENRILKPHSLRYTYNTKMRRRIPEDKLRAMIGHDVKSMTDYYTIINIAELEEQFLELRDSAQAIDGFWG